MKRNTFPFQSVLAASVCALSVSAFAQSKFEAIENRFLDVITTFRTDARNLDPTDVKQLISNIETYSGTSDLAAIEKFTLPYYQGYLYYVWALARGNALLLESAASKFQTAIKAYEPIVQLPDKRAFAQYMRAWCSLRGYYLAQQNSDVQPLRAALGILAGLQSNADARYLVDDIHFLKGYAQYLMAREKFEKLEFDSLVLNQAIADFSSAASGEKELNKLSKLYHAAALFTRSKYLALSKLVPKQRIVIAKDMALADAMAAADSFGTMPPEFGKIANFDHYLSNRFAPVMTGLKINSGNTLFDAADFIFGGVDRRPRNLLEDYSYFLNYLSTAQDPGNSQSIDVHSESRFWQDLTDYLIYLSAEGQQKADTALFKSNPPKDWRSKYMGSLIDLYRNESRVLASVFEDISVDTLNLIPFHRPRAHYLKSLFRLTQRLGPRCDIKQLDSVKELIVTKPGEITSGYTAIFGANNSRGRQSAYRFANYFMTLASKNRDLYPVAYLTYEFLNKVNFEKEKTILLKAYCEYNYQGKSQIDNNDVLALLNDDTIDQFTRDNWAEARYYRAMIYRKVDGPEFGTRVVPELTEIKNNHPYAGYGLGYERFRTVDVDLMNKVYTQACVTDTSLKDLCKSVKALTGFDGYDPKEVKAEPIYIGDPDVRFEKLRDLRTDFVMREKRLLVDYWQLFSSPLHVAVPDTGELLNCNFRGPREFYLGNRIEINLSLGKPDTLKQVTISSQAEGCTRFVTMSADTVLEVLARRSYQISVATKGHYPTRIDTSFGTNKATLGVTYDDALQSTNSFVADKGGELRIDSENEYHIASKNDEPFLRLYKSGNALWSDTPNYSAIAWVRGKYYVLDRLSSQVWELGSDDNLKKLENFDESILKKPSDLTDFGDHLVVSNSGDNTLVLFNTQNKKTEVAKVAGAGRIESVVAIRGKLFVTDWKVNTIWMGDLKGFEKLLEKVDVDSIGMIAPTKISLIKDQYIVVSDVVSNQLFLFDRTGAYLDAFEIRSEGVAAPRLVSLKHQGSRREFEIHHALGTGRQGLTKKQGYPANLNCGADLNVLQRTLGDEASRFCVRPIN